MVVAQRESKYLKWLSMHSVASKTKIESVITEDALATLSEKLTTPLQFEYYQTRAFEKAYNFALRYSTILRPLK